MCVCVCHANTSWDIYKELILQMETDQMIPRYALNRTHKARFPNRSEWGDEF